MAETGVMTYAGLILEGCVLNGLVVHKEHCLVRTSRGQCVQDVASDTSSSICPCQLCQQKSPRLRKRGDWEGGQAQSRRLMVLACSSRAGLPCAVCWARRGRERVAPGRRVCHSRRARRDASSASRTARRPQRGGIMRHLLVGSRSSSWGHLTASFLTQFFLFCAWLQSALRLT
jgi:hypothetical protein